MMDEGVAAAVATRMFLEVIGGAMRKICFALIISSVLLSACGHSACDSPNSITGAAIAPIGEQKATPRHTIHIVDYGPHEAKVNTPFNQQPDGRSAIWFKLDESVEGSLVNVHVGSQVIKGDISADVVTVKIPDELHASAGTLVMSIDKVDGQVVKSSNSVTLVLDNL